MTGVICNYRDKEEFESLKNTAEIGIGELRDSSLGGVDLTDLDVPVNENTAVFVSRTTVMNRGRGQDFIDPYQICQDFLNRQAHRRMEGTKDDLN